jgi:hypothetical protein
MSLSMYDACVPTFTQILRCQANILDKAAAYADARKIDHSVMLDARLFPDMFPLKRQVQISTDFANRAAARLSGSEIPSHPDTEQSFGELKERVLKTAAFVSGLQPAQFDGAASKTYSIPMGGDRKEEMTGQNYLFHFALPNFLFHATTAYGILRHSGVEIGKMDFMQP